MDELEQIKQKKLQELQQQEQAELQQQVEQLEAMVKQRMTKEALQRYGNIKTAHPGKAMQILVLFGQMIQSNQIQAIDDETLKNTLIQLNQKKDFKIKFK